LYKKEDKNKKLQFVAKLFYFFDNLLYIFYENQKFNQFKNM